MKQECIDKLMNEIDRKCKFPKYWNDFVEKNSAHFHIIIKDKTQKNLYCTNCKHTFIDKTVKVRDYMECPHCKQKSIVYGLNFYRTSFEQSIILAQRMNKQVIIRVFEIYSYFDKDTKQMVKSVIEYARIIPGVGKFIGNNVDIGMYGTMRIYHGYKKLTWYKYNGYRFFTDHPVYPFNKQKLLKGTSMEYAPIDEFMRKFSYYRYNFFDVLEFAAYSSFEILWNMKLYYLCFYSKALNKNGSFYKRFKLPKNFLKFMQDNNITYKELLLLQLFQKQDNELLQKYRYKNINHIRFLFKNNFLDSFEKFGLNINSENIKILKDISNFVPLKKLANYPKGIQNLHIYNDYLAMSKKLALNYVSKKDLFPRNLMARHDKLQNQIKVTEDTNTQFGAYLRFLKLSKYIYADSKYIIFPAPSVVSMKDEGTQQGNCVGNMYVDRYINGETEIFFIRKQNDLKKSFITLEYKDGRVVQKELTNHSRNFEAEHLNFIEKWLGYRSFIEQKIKLKNKNQFKIKEYKFNKIAA